MLKFGPTSNKPMMEKCFCTEDGTPSTRLNFMSPIRFSIGGQSHDASTHGVHMISGSCPRDWEGLSRPSMTGEILHNLSQDADCHTSFKVGFNNDGTITAVKIDNICAKWVNTASTTLKRIPEYQTWR